MVNYHIELVNTLATILPTHYEMTLYSGLDTPCISYIMLNNYVETNGKTKGYSRITYQIKVWGNDIVELNNYAEQIDNKVRAIGFKRIASNELYDNNSAMIQKILTFEALALEEFN